MEREQCARLARRTEKRVRVSEKRRKRKTHQWTADFVMSVFSQALRPRIHAVRDVQNGGQPLSVKPLSYAIPRVTGNRQAFRASTVAQPLGRKQMDERHLVTASICLEKETRHLR